MRRMLFEERLAYGARAVMMASTVVIAAIFLRMIAVRGQKPICQNDLSWIRILVMWDTACLKEMSLLSP